MNNKRTLKRHQLMYYLPVTDRNTAQVIGHLADITAEGIMTVGSQPLKPDTVYQLYIDLPAAVQGKSRLEFDGRTLWSRPDVNPSLHAAGIEILDTQERDVAMIVGIINSFLFPR